MRNTQHMLIQVCCAPPVLFHSYCPTAEVQWGRIHMEGSESILSLLADPEFLREFLSHIKISWPPERLTINTKCTSLNSTAIHPVQLCLSSYFTCSWQLGWVMSCQECFFLGTKRCRSGHEPSPSCGVMADGSSAWLWLLLGGKNTNNQGQEQTLQGITRPVVFSGFAFSMPGWVEGQD